MSALSTDPAIRARDRARPIHDDVPVRSEDARLSDGRREEEIRLGETSDRVRYGDGTITREQYHRSVR